MIWVLFVLLLLLGLVLWAPVELKVDTTKDVYWAGWKGIFSVQVVPSEEEGFRFFYRVFFYCAEWRPGADKRGTASPKNRPKPQKPVRAKRSPSLSWQKGWALFRNLLRAVEVKRFYLDIDTDDYVRNALLFPLFSVLRTKKRELSINFQGRQELILHARVRPMWVAGALIRTFLPIKILKR